MLLNIMEKVSSLPKFERSPVPKLAFSKKVVNISPANKMSLKNSPKNPANIKKLPRASKNVSKLPAANNSAAVPRAVKNPPGTIEIS